MTFPMAPLTPFQRIYSKLETVRRTLDGATTIALHESVSPEAHGSLCQLMTLASFASTATSDPHREEVLFNVLCDAVNTYRKLVYGENGV